RINPNNGNYDAVDTDNPRFYDEGPTLPAAAANRPIASIDIAWAGTGANTHTAIFALSGTLNPIPEPSSLALVGLGGRGPGARGPRAGGAAGGSGSRRRHADRNRSGRPTRWAGPLCCPGTSDLHESVPGAR